MGNVLAMVFGKLRYTELVHITQQLLTQKTDQRINFLDMCSKQKGNLTDAQQAYDRKLELEIKKIETQLTIYQKQLEKYEEAAKKEGGKLAVSLTG